MEGGGGERRDSITGEEKRAMGLGGVIERGFFTGMPNDPHFLHLMNKKSADWIERHSN